MESRKYAALISYLGADFCGWQKQKGLGKHFPSIQATFESALTQMTGEVIRTVASGRTDSGVHAVGQVVHFMLESQKWDVGTLQKGLNGILPMTIRVLGLLPVPLEFHAQRSAEKKQYSYYFQQGPCPLPQYEPLSWWIRKSLNVEAMAQGLQYLQGSHDFKPFQGAGAKPGGTVRTLFEAEVSYEPLGFPRVLAVESQYESFKFVRVRVVGSGFLKQMVRGIAGTLLQVGEGRRPPEDFQQILETGERFRVGPTAPSRALWLEKVWYPEEFSLW